MQPFGRNGYGPKIGGLCPFGGGELGPHLTVTRAEAYLPAKFHLDSSQYTNITDRQTGQGRTERQTDRQRSDSIGRNILQTVAQKLHKNDIVFTREISFMIAIPALICIISLTLATGVVVMSSVWYLGWNKCFSKRVSSGLDLDSVSHTNK